MQTFYTLTRILVLGLITIAYFFHLSLSILSFYVTIILLYSVKYSVIIFEYQFRALYFLELVLDLYFTFVKFITTFNSFKLAYELVVKFFVQFHSPFRQNRTYFSRFL